jgi:nucleoid DNA-binding protein
LVRIPGESKASKNEALRNCIEFAASHSGVDEYKVAEIMTLFLEQVADEMTKGRVLQIPGFGAFFPVPDRHPPRKDQPRRCRVRFHPSVGFQQQVKYGSAPQDSVLRKFNNYRMNHSAGDRSAGHNSRVFSAMKHFRDSIAQQYAHARD